jgi:hypothetical protein
MVVCCELYRTMDNRKSFPAIRGENAESIEEAKEEDSDPDDHFNVKTRKEDRNTNILSIPKENKFEQKEELYKSVNENMKMAEGESDKEAKLKPNDKFEYKAKYKMKQIGEEEDDENTNSDSTDSKGSGGSELDFRKRRK